MIKVKRVYTTKIKPNQTVYDLVEWKRVTLSLLDHTTGKEMLHEEGLEFPKDFSQNACNIIAGKYFYRGDTHKEVSYREVIHRLVSFWRDALIDEKLLDRKDSDIFYDEVAFMMLTQMMAPNSPQFFNTGICKYTKGSPNGMFYYDEKIGKSVKSKDSYSRTNGSACYIVGVNDSLLGDHSISDTLTTETKLFKFGSGIGANWSKIRARGEKLTNGGVSSGLMSFLKVGDQNAGAIKSGGTTRRAAKMITLNEDHPEILNFIEWKKNEEDKVRALGLMGYDTDITGSAYETVSGQNVNNSVVLTDTFMENINTDKTLKLKGRTDNSINSSVKIADLYNTIAECAHACGDPAPQFRDNINAYHTCPNGRGTKTEINSSNPCGEYFFIDDSACNLASLNMVKFIDADNVLDMESFTHAIELTQLILEATIYWGQYPTEDIAYNSYMYRPTGLGITNVHSMLLCLGLGYESEQSQHLVGYIANYMTAVSYLISSQMAEIVGSFKAHIYNEKPMKKVLQQHADLIGKGIQVHGDLLKLDPSMINKYVSTKDPEMDLQNIWNVVLSAKGYRNAQVSLIAPTGTISFAMDSISTSIEPIFSHKIYKKTIDNTVIEIVNPYISSYLKARGLSDITIDHIMSELDTKDMTEIPELTEYLQDLLVAMPNKNGQAISVDGHLNLLKYLAHSISGGISKTVNLPSTASVIDVKDVFYKAWKFGLKGITIYRDNSKACQPLSTSNEGSTNTVTYNKLLQYYLENKSKPDTSIPVRNKPKGVRTTHTHPCQLNGIPMYVHVSKYNGKIAEVFINSDKTGSLIAGLMNSLAMEISRGLQYSIPAAEIAQGLRGQKYEPNGIVYRHPYIKACESMSDLLAKIIEFELGDYSRCEVKPDGYTETKPVINLTKEEIDREVLRSYTGEKCFNCGSSKLMKAGTCKVCADCGSTTGCS